MKIVNTQRAITPKVGKPESWFMCSAHRFKVFNICVKFHEKVSSCFKLMEWTRNNCLQRAITQKSRKNRVTVHVFCMSSYSV